MQGLLVSWGQRLQESSWQEKETKNNPERESPERGTGKWGVEGLLEQGNSDASLPAQAGVCTHAPAHTNAHSIQTVGTHTYPSHPYFVHLHHTLLNRPHSLPHPPTAQLPTKYTTYTLIMQPPLVR